MKKAPTITAAALCLALAGTAHATEILNVDTGELFPTIQAAHDDADTLDGHTLEVVVASHDEGIVTISKNLTLRSDDGATINPTTNTGSSGDSRGWFLVEPDVGVHVENLTFDGAGNQIHQAFRIHGGGTFTNCHFRNVFFSTYIGIAIVPFGDDVDIVGCSFDNIERVGVLYFGDGITGSRFENNTYVGKGDGDFLDYCLDISAGARVFVRNNTVTDCRGVASSDGSTSAAFLVTTFFGPGTEAIFTGNTMTDNTTGVAVGFDNTDTSTVTAHFNNFSGNSNGIFSTAPAVDAGQNWWGDASGPHDPNGTIQASPDACPGAADAMNPGGLGDEVDDALITYCPWLLAPVEGAPASADGLVNVTKANGNFVAGSGISAESFTSATNGDVSVWLKARNRDGVGGQPIARSGNVYYINPGIQHQTFDFQFTPSETDTLGGGDYHLRLTVDLDPSAGTTGALCPGSSAAGSPIVLDQPLFDADADPSNSWDDTDGFFTNPGAGAWSTDDVPYVFSQSWHMGFSFLNGADICPGDYNISWEVLEGAPNDPLRRKLAGTSVIMRVLETPDVVPTHLNLSAFETCAGLNGNQLIVDVDMQQVTEAVNGGQFWLAYDNSLLDFVSADPGLAPFTREIIETVDENAGTIFYAVGVQNGIGPATADSRLARLTFGVATGALPEFCSTSDLVEFVPGQMPPTQLTTPGATAVLATETNLPAASGDLTPPVLTPPMDVSVAADAGFCSAAIDPGLAVATDNCSGDVEITFARSDGKPSLLDLYEAADSPITIMWAAKDECGNMSFAPQTVEVSGTNELNVSVELDGVSNSFTRCITFELFDAADNATEVKEELAFAGGVFTGTIEVPCGDYVCITARDELHTLRRTDDDDFGTSGTQYVADFTGGDALVSGNVNDDFYIDILDFGGYAGQFGAMVGANTTCSDSPIHADFSGNGQVAVEDFTFIQTNFLETHEVNCDGGPNATAPPVARITVEELRARGDHDLARGDVNHDGWLDADDLSAVLLAGGMPCTADFNADGGVNVFDLLLYLDLWFKADPAADMAGGQNVDVFDLLGFLDAWFAGCE